MFSTLFAPGTIHLHAAQSGHGGATLCIERAYVALCLGQRVDFVTAELRPEIVKQRLLILHAMKVLGADFPRDLSREATLAALRDLPQYPDERHNFLPCFQTLCGGLRIFSTLAESEDASPPDLLVLHRVDLLASEKGHVWEHLPNTLDELRRRMSETNLRAAREGLRERTQCFATIQRGREGKLAPTVVALADVFTLTTKIRQDPREF